MRFLKSKIKMLLKKLIRMILHDSSLKERVLPVVRRFPNVYIRLKRFNYSTESISGEKNEIILSEEGSKVYHDLKIMMTPRLKKHLFNLGNRRANRN